LVPGHKPSHEAKRLSLWKRDMSVPSSETTTSAVVTSMASMRERSTRATIHQCR
jgi:hypothetical protein